MYIFPKQYIPSTLPNACVAASLAMVTQQSLEQVIDDLLPNWQETGQFYGIEYEVVEQYLSNKGIACQPVDHDYPPKEQLILNWPIPAWAPAHLVYVFDEGSHCVVLWEDGEVYDPNDVNIHDLASYRRVYSMVGLWKVASPHIIL